MSDESKSLERKDVSIITPIHNGKPWIKEYMQSILLQSFQGSIELCIYDDASTDKTFDLIKAHERELEKRGIFLKIEKSLKSMPSGVGYAKNRAVLLSSGKYLCFLDIDDMIHENRILEQFNVAEKLPNNTLIGCQFWREPEGSTERFTNWANSLSDEQLYTQAYTSHGPTIIMPTWFCSRELFDKVGGFDERGKGVPEDLIFFYKHLDLDGKIYKVPKPLLMYRYHAEATTFSVKEETIWDLRVKAVQQHILHKWKSFTIWNAGKQGRQFFRSLEKKNQDKVVSFCDVDEKKIVKGFYVYEESKNNPKPKIPIIHFTKAKPPFIICVKLGLTKGEFEKNLESLNLLEGRDFYHFN